MYSAMNCAPHVQARIQKIYSMDGPGFRPEILKKCGYEKIADKVVKILPHASLIGMLFERDINYNVVDSKTMGVFQHNPYNWIVKKGKFVEMDDVAERVKRRDNHINEWLLTLDEQQLKLFVDTLYQVISASDAEDLIAFTANWKKSIFHVIAALKEIDENTTRILKSIIRSLFEIARTRVKEPVVKGLSEEAISFSERQIKNG